MEELFDPKDYNDIFQYIRLSYNEMVRPLKDYKMKFSPIHNIDAEWNIHFPILVRPFYAFIYRNHRIPEQQEYVSYYLTENRSFFENEEFDHKVIEGLKARLLRTYPSLVRDICFNRYVKDHAIGYKTIYNISLDVERDIDLMLYKGQNYYGVCLYTKTKRALYSRTKKTNRHVRFSNVNYIEILKDFKGSMQIGDFFLYGEQEYKELMELVDMSSRTSKNI